MIEKIKYIIKKVLPHKEFELTFYEPTKKTVIIIDDEIPQYNKSSGARRLYEIIKIFKKLHFNVIFVASNGRMLEPYYQDLINLQVNVLLKWPNRKGMLRTLKKLLPLADLAWLCRPEINVEFQKIIKNEPKINIIFDTVDLHFLRLERQADVDHNDKLKSLSLRTKILELGLAKASNYTITITDVEKRILESEGVPNVYTIPNIHLCLKTKEQHPFEKRSGIVFIGGYLHVPNIDAVKWLIREIMPLVWNKLGDIPVYLLGSNPTEEVLSLAGENVYVPGFIEDVSDYFYNAKLSVAPLRFGAGMKGKIGQSLEFGLPVVSTSIGVEGMPLEDNINCLVADDIELFATNIIELYSNATLWEKIRNNGDKTLANYTPEVVTEQLSALFKN